MIKLEIAGNDVTHFFQEFANAALLLTQGGNTTFKPAPAATVDAGVGAARPAQTDDLVQDAVAEPNPPVVEKPKRKAKEKAAPVDAGIPDFLDRNNKPAAPVDDAKQYTLDDMRDRVKAIITAHTETRGHKMQEAVAYVRELFKPFGIKLAAELKPEQFADFMAKSQPYLDGTAK